MISLFSCFTSWSGAATLLNLLLSAFQCLQHKFGKCVPKALRSYLQVPSLMSHHYLEVNPIRLGGKIRMALGAQRASPCAPGRRRARIALETQPLPAALPAAVLRIALGLSITQRATRCSCGRSAHCANCTQRATAPRYPQWHFGPRRATRWAPHGHRTAGCEPPQTKLTVWRVCITYTRNIVVVVRGSVGVYKL